MGFYENNCYFRLFLFTRCFQGSHIPRKTRDTCTLGLFKEILLLEFNQSTNNTVPVVIIIMLFKSKVIKTEMKLSK